MSRIEKGGVLMALSARTIKKQLAMLRPLLDARSLEASRKGQNKIGELMEARYKDKVLVREHRFDCFSGAWIIPKDERRRGVILYIHGGGYTYGDIEYAKGCGATVAHISGSKVFAVAYRLAPENRFPAALEDCIEAYKYLLEKGYSGDQITLCGDSAGGGMCFSLCAVIREARLPIPGAVIAISPWTDLTGSGESYETNKDIDPSMNRRLLEFFADSYTDRRKDPLVSPLFANVEGFPPALIFVGGDEIMLDDSRLMHEKLLAAGVKSKLVVAPERWHGYVLYNLRENMEDHKTINQFLNKYIGEENKLRWLPLDNAAKIYPAARRQNWSNVFRLSVTLKEEVDRDVLQSALDVTVRRFPSIAARLRRGLFWYYLEQVSESPKVSDENSYPLARMSKAETSRCALRVIAYKKRIAVEFFHSLTDGNGGMIFLKTLAAEYLHQKHGIYVPSENGVLGRLEEPSPEELEDSFLKCAGNASASRMENNAYRLSGIPEEGDFLNLTCFKIPVRQVLDGAHKYKVSLTTFVCAAVMSSILDIQKENVPDIRRRRHVRVLIPVNLRKMFGSKTLRNFVLYTIPEVDGKLGDYTFSEICSAIHHRMGLEVNAKQMSTKIATNVGDETKFIVKLMPLFVKNLVMKAVFNAVGERKSSLTLSNLGAISVPDVMKDYIDRFDFILGVQATAPYNCGVLSYGDTLYVNFIRSTKEPVLESHFHRVLRDMGIDVTVESNQNYL